MGSRLWVISYIDGTLDVRFCYRKGSDALDLLGFVDSDFAGDNDTRKFSTAINFTFGRNSVSYKSDLQATVTLL